MTNHKPEKPPHIFKPVGVIVGDSGKHTPSPAGLNGDQASIETGVSPDPLLSLQPNGTILSVNQRAADMLSTPETKCIGTPE